VAIARDLGTPPEQARALEGIGRSHLGDGHPAQAAALLRDALAINQRIASPAARHVEKTLRQYGLPQPQHTRPEPGKLPVNAGDRHATRSRASNSSYRQIQLHNAALWHGHGDTGHVSRSVPNGGSAPGYHEPRMSLTA